VPTNRADLFDEAFTFWTRLRDRPDLLGQLGLA
jgi:hypothetical protein